MAEQSYSLLMTFLFLKVFTVKRSHVLCLYVNYSRWQVRPPLQKHNNHQYHTLASYRHLSRAACVNITTFRCVLDFQFTIIVHRQTVCLSLKDNGQMKPTQRLHTVDWRKEIPIGQLQKVAVKIT